MGIFICMCLLGGKSCCLQGTGALTEVSVAKGLKRNWPGFQTVKDEGDKGMCAA